jgi:hypothetical protein
MLKRQHTEGNLDDGEGDVKRSRVEDMALVAVPTEESQQLIIAENNNKVRMQCSNAKRQSLCLLNKQSTSYIGIDG